MVLCQMAFYKPGNMKRTADPQEVFAKYRSLLDCLPELVTLNSLSLKEGVAFQRVNSRIVPLGVACDLCFFGKGGEKGIPTEHTQNRVNFSEWTFSLLCKQDPLKEYKPGSPKLGWSVFGNLHLNFFKSKFRS